MVYGFVFLTVERTRINDVAEELTGIDGISEVYSIAGRYDLIALLRVRDNEQLAGIVTDRLLKVEGIIDSETMVALKVHSRHDLERMFAIGFGGEEAE